MSRKATEIDVPKRPPQNRAYIMHFKRLLSEQQPIIMINLVFYYYRFNVFIINISCFGMHDRLKIWVVIIFYLLVYKKTSLPGRSGREKMNEI